MPTGVGIQGLRGTGEFSVDFRPTNYRELYTMLEPNGSAPMNALLAMGSSEETDDPTYNNFRDEMPARVLQVNYGAGYNTSATALTIDADNDIGFAVTGTLIANQRTGEIMRCSADSSGTTLTVTRNIGGTALSILDNDVLAIVGSAFAEGSGAPTSVSFDPDLAYNLIQIFKTAFSVTGTTKETFFRTGDKEDEYSKKALKLHMSDIERAMFFGKRAESGANNAKLRFTGGLLTTITTVEDVASATVAYTWSEDDFDRWLIDTCFAFGSKEKVVFCGAQIAGHLQAIAKNRWQPTQIDNTYGINVTGYKTFAGTLMVHLHPQFRQISSLASTAIFLDFPYIKYRHLKNRDTRMEENIQANDADEVKHQYVSDCGLELLQDKVHSVVKNWTIVGA